MNRRTRALFLIMALAALGLAAVVVLFVLPPPKSCPSIECGDFRSGAVDVFGAGNFTLPQTIVIAVAIFVTAGLLARALAPQRGWLSGGIAALALALAVGWSLPPRPVGPFYAVHNASRSWRSTGLGTVRDGPFAGRFRDVVTPAGDRCWHRCSHCHGG